MQRQVSRRLCSVVPHAYRLRHSPWPLARAERMHDPDRCLVSAIAMTCPMNLCQNQGQAALQQVRIFLSAAAQRPHCLIPELLAIASATCNSIVPSLGKVGEKSFQIMNSKISWKNSTHHVKVKYSGTCFYKTMPALGDFA